MAVWALLMMMILISGILAQQDMGDKVFVFPKETDTDCVLLKPKITKPLEKLTICLRSYTELSRIHALFSFATPDNANAFLIFANPPNAVALWKNDQEGLHFTTDAKTIDWRHTCMTWDSQTGVVQLWVDGKLYPRKVTVTRSPITTETSIMLGQDQDSFGGKFDKKQSFLGEMSDVHMWDDVLSNEDIRKVLYGDYSGNIINWRALSYEIKGQILVQPKLQCKSLGHVSSIYTFCN